MSSPFYRPATDMVDMTKPGAVARLLSLHRDIFGGFRMAVGDSGDQSGGDQSGGGDDPRVNANGYPDETPVKDMTEGQQVAYWKFHARKHEDESKARGDYDAQKADAEKWRQAQLEKLPADERALTDARQKADTEARADERGKFGRQLVASEVRGALRGHQLPDDRIESLVGPLDHNYFLTATGEVDAAKVSEYASGFGAEGGTWPDMGQGRRGQGGPAKGVDAGRDLYRDRNTKK